jgi:hypothetical protein
MRVCANFCSCKMTNRGAGSVRVTDIDSSVSGMPATKSNEMCSAMVLSAELGDACVSRIYVYGFVQGLSADCV